jgi:hypothetical protein
MCSLSSPPSRGKKRGAPKKRRKK